MRSNNHFCLHRQQYWYVVNSLSVNDMKDLQENRHEDPTEAYYEIYSDY